MCIYHLCSSELFLILVNHHRFDFICNCLVYLQYFADRTNPLKSKSKSRYNWRSVSPSVLVSSPFWGSWLHFIVLLSQSWALQTLSFSVALSDKKLGLPFAVSSSLSALHHLQHYIMVVHNEIFCYIHKTSVSPGCLQQIVPYLNLAYALMAAQFTWTVVDFTAAKYKPLILWSWSWFLRQFVQILWLCDYFFV
jgi:hypothetical protein